MPAEQAGIPGFPLESPVLCLAAEAISFVDFFASVLAAPPPEVCIEGTGAVRPGCVWSPSTCARIRRSCVPQRRARPFRAVRRIIAGTPGFISLGL